MSSSTYYRSLQPVLEQAFSTQADVLTQVANRLADVIASGNLVYVFGAGHAGIIAEEMCYRAGGLVPVVPIFAPGLAVATRPATLETEMERLSGYAHLILQSSRITPQDALIIHSNSGRNTVAIEMAEEAHQAGIYVIALTSVTHSRSVTSRHPRGLKLMDLADAVIDNCGVPGDAICEIPGQAGKAGSTSTVVGAALMNALMVETSEILVGRGVDLPLFRSANLDEGADSNQFWMDHYGSRLLYL